LAATFRLFSLGPDIEFPAHSLALVSEAEGTMPWASVLRIWPPSKTLHSFAYVDVRSSWPRTLSHRGHSGSTGDTGRQRIARSLFKSYSHESPSRSGWTE